MYAFIKSFLFLMDPETAHYTTFSWIRLLHKIPFAEKILKKIFVFHNAQTRVEVAGIQFPGVVGLAAGFDKDAMLFDELSSFGFSHIEIGTLTPLPQPGNDKPRLFRLPADKALINRMGFNNKGAEPAARRLHFKKNEDLIIGGNIGKNKNTPNEEALGDYLKCFDMLYEEVNYFTVNVSSPNTPGLRALQEKEPLQNLLGKLKERALSQRIYKPIFLKIAPDLSKEQLDEIIEIVFETKIDGIIATNTTLSRDGLKSNARLSAQTGGLSGAPLKEKSTEIVSYIVQKSEGRFPVIAAGGIMSVEDAMEKFRAGAALVQIYSGFIYKGPGLIKAINKRYAQLKKSGKI